MAPLVVAPLVVTEKRFRVILVIGTTRAHLPRASHEGDLNAIGCVYLCNTIVDFV